MNSRNNIKITYEEVEQRLNQFKDENGNLHCIYCNRPIVNDEMLHIEHFIPIAKGGTNSIDNIIPTCRYCNRSKADEDFTYWYRNQLFYDKEHEKYILNLMKVS